MKRATLLIVEDEAIVAADLEGRLVRMGYAVCGRAASGEEALALARTHRPRLVLLDIQLQGTMDGIEVAHILRAELEIPVIFLSANSDETMIQRASLAGPYGYLLKPFNERELHTNIEVALHKHQGDRQLAAAHLEVQRLNSTLEQRVRERTAEVEAELREVEAIAYAVAHHLRSPLRGMEGFAYLLRTRFTEGLAEQARHLPQAIHTSAIRMGHLLDDLLRFIKLRRQPMQIERVDTAAIVHDVLNEFASLEPGRLIEVRIDELPHCRADATLLRQVFVELLSNALKFGHKDRARAIVVGAHPPGEDSDRQIYFVRDNGIGLDARYADKLFRLFSPLNPPHASREGTGAGLAIARRILERMRGSIWAEPSPGGGATLLFSLPGAA